MFAPYCSACRRRVLLGTNRIVRFDFSGAGRHVVVLRCLCGTHLDWDQRPGGPSERGTRADHAEPVAAVSNPR